VKHGKYAHDQPMMPCNEGILLFPNPAIDTGLASQKLFATWAHHRGWCSNIGAYQTTENVNHFFIHIWKHSRGIHL